jgi:hypothetical protein
MLRRSRGRGSFPVISAPLDEPLHVARELGEVVEPDAQQLVNALEPEVEISVDEDVPEACDTAEPTGELKRLD